MDKRSTFLGALAFVAAVLVAVPVDAGLVSVTNYANSGSLWQGFPADFNPDWQGDTATVVTRPVDPTELLITGGIFDCISTVESIPHWTGSILDSAYLDMSPWQEQKWTVNRRSSRASARAATDATVDFAGDCQSAYKADTSEGSAALARYAAVVSDTGWLLANGSAIACQNVDFGPRSFTADGVFSANCFRVAANGSVSASGNTEFSATYSLEQDTPFSLDLDLSQWGNAELVFQAVDDATDEVVFAFETVSSITRHVELDGILAAGEYTFTLNGSADAALGSTGRLDFGGMASYDVALDFQAETYWVTHYPPGWHGNDVLVISDGGDGCVVWLTDPSSAGANFLIVSADVLDVIAVPEPATVALLLWGVVALLVVRYRSAR
jgi:hypothetical protein